MSSASHCTSVVSLTKISHCSYLFFNCRKTHGHHSEGALFKGDALSASSAAPKMEWLSRWSYHWSREKTALTPVTSAAVAFVTGPTATSVNRRWDLKASGHERCQGSLVCLHHTCNFKVSSKRKEKAYKALSPELVMMGDLPNCSILQQAEHQKAAVEAKIHSVGSRMSG